LSLAWFYGLPSDVRPIRLMRQYPRLVNLVALEWDNPHVAGTLLTDLVNGNRSVRDGFPAAVFRELQALRDYFYNAFSLNA
jgi:hypothetical protein